MSQPSPPPLCDVILEWPLCYTPALTLFPAIFSDNQNIIIEAQENEMISENTDDILMSFRANDFESFLWESVFIQNVA